MDWEGSDVVARNAYSDAELAAMVSRCRPQAMTFDGIEKMFKPLYDFSPDVKVIVLDWRTYGEWKQSWAGFFPISNTILLAMSYLTLGMHIMPWNAFLFPILDPLTGSTIENFMREGTSHHRGIEDTLGFEPV